MQIQKLYQFFLKHPIICTDNRKITKGSVFFSLKGENFNGNEFAEKAINAIQNAAYSGKIGDGKIFVSSIEQVLRIRTGEKDSDAV